jgi:hypothetical protein
MREAQLDNTTPAAMNTTYTLRVATRSSAEVSEASRTDEAYRPGRGHGEQFAPARAAVASVRSHVLNGFIDEGR